jgi:serine/threonine-protein kinase
LDVGTVVGGKYRLSRTLGEGSMGSVWAAVHEVLGREVAIKFQRQSFEDAHTAAQRFAAEAKAAALVKHRFVVDVFDFGVTEDGDSYMVQELLQGRPLSDLLTEGPAWTVRDAVRFVMDCLSGLSAVHARGIIHRDLKPENIFVIPEVDGSVPKLLDFGISKSADKNRERSPKRPSLRAPGRGRLTAFGATLGTPAYMSPEQLRNLSTLDARADLYSLGVVFYEWLAGHCPYASNPNFAELVEQIESRSMTLLEELRPDIGPELCAVVTRALDPDRDQRYGSALEMRTALAQTLDLLPDAMTRVQRQTQPSVRLPPLRMPQFTPQAVPNYELPPVSLKLVPKPRSLPPPLPLASEPPLSIMPAGMRRSPSWKFWSAAAVVAGLAIGTALALRSVSTHATARVQAAPTPIAAPPVAAPPAEAAAEEELPYGALPPENTPDQELSAPPVEPSEPTREHKRERKERAALEAPPHVAQPKREAPEPKHEAREPKPEPKRAPESSDKLLRSLDF